MVNIEWPGFATPELPVLDEDRDLDAASNNPGQQQARQLRPVHEGELSCVSGCKLTGLTPALGGPGAGGSSLAADTLPYDLSGVLVKTGW